MKENKMKNMEELISEQIKKMDIEKIVESAISDRVSSVLSGMEFELMYKIKESFYSTGIDLKDCRGFEKVVDKTVEKIAEAKFGDGYPYEVRSTLEDALKKSFNYDSHISYLIGQYLEKNWIQFGRNDFYIELKRKLDEILNERVRKLFEFREPSEEGLLKIIHGYIGERLNEIEEKDE